MVFGPAKARRAELRGDRTRASRVDKSCLPNLSYPPEDPCFKLRGSGKSRRCAAQNGTGRSLQGFAPRAPNGRDRPSPARAICGSSLLQVNSVRAPTLGLAAPFSVRPRRCTTRKLNRRYRGWSKCIPVGSAASTLTEPLEQAPDDSDRRHRAAHSSSTGANRKLC
jgi:hypothetical protein